MIDNCALVLEGGGIRGVFSAGVLDFFLDKQLHFPYITGVSAGACNAFSYISKQRTLNHKIFTDFLRDKRYASVRNLIKTGNVFNMDTIFQDLQGKLLPFDYDAFKTSEQELVIGATNMLNGETVYFNKSDYLDNINHLFNATKASSSLPFYSQIVKFEGYDLLDGGLSDPVPYKKALELHKKAVVVLTRDSTFRQKPYRRKQLLKYFYKDYPNFIKLMLDKYSIYNDHMIKLSKLEEEGKILIIRPEKPVKFKRLERNLSKLNSLYSEGYNIAKDNFEKISSFLG
ncbi:patatin-like phospholipase family protein [Oceanirhabdus sp. W0125-5]|uniref:patatin-like phospholipase family protein n=1 Tax=Oceanirhabdus sp. W0125-5 TaxID=2999116 RepID=UPI0022F2D968|nr:patatin family protein [Oceanirhabdus sp. W0125-5]WBW98752.1 patatin family protein [Oceanirhabdus sp. W0125-5]